MLGLGSLPSAALMSDKCHVLFHLKLISATLHVFGMRTDVQLKLKIETVKTRLKARIAFDH